MCENNPEVDSIDIDDAGAPRQRRRWWIWVAAGLALAALAFLGRDIYGQWARYRATNDMDAWAINDALAWLDRADRLDAGDGQTELLRAKCYRHLQQWDRRAEALRVAEEQGAATRALRDEIILGQIQSGQLGERAEDKLGELTEAGIAPADIATSYIEGSLTRQDMQRARMLLEAWAADFPDEPHVHYMSGVLAQRNGDTQRAREEFEKTLDLQPRHELALIAMAGVYQDASQFDQALALYKRLVAINPTNSIVLARLVQLLRKLGHIDLARQVLAPAMKLQNPPLEVTVEAGQLELELADYQAAQDWFQRCPAKEMTNHTILSAAATVLSMLGQIPASQRAYDWMADEVSAVTVMHDLRARLEFDPQDKEAAGEFQQLLQRLASKSGNINPLELATEGDPNEPEQSPGKQLYAQHCLACHGPNGAGDGHAARFVYPRPRNLRTEKMRLVSTRNGVPTRNDIIRVIRQGIPGTAMAAVELRDDQLEQLADVVLKMQRDGARETYIAALEADDEEVDPDDVAEVVTVQTSPAGIATPPPIPAPNDSLLRLGKELYTKQSCHSCHGETGVGDVNTPLFDDLGRPDFPRDLVHEVFKGGNTPGAIYMRILLGMPGTPHPANVSLSQDELIALALYTHSLGKEPKRKLTDHERYIQASSRPAVEF